MNAFTIKDLENLSGIKAHTIRMWEQRYNFLKPQRSCTNIRYYTNEELKTILNISLLNKHGFKISHIDKMQPEEISTRILELRDSDAQQERIINELLQQMVDLETDQFESTLNRYIKTNGIERTVKEIVFPFLEKIGILWQTGHITPAQEHFVTNIIRQKLIVAIDATPSNKEGVRALLFLPEREYHELGLLFLAYILKSRGANILYLGANVPMKDVESIIVALKPEVAFIHLTSTSPNFNFDRLLKELQIKAANITTYISGFPTWYYNKPVPAGIQLKKSFAEVMELANGI
jgi:MerR family transcriptional regulator, light-induced transcriptional regulator